MGQDSELELFPRAVAWAFLFLTGLSIRDEVFAVAISGLCAVNALQPKGISA